MSYFQQKMVLHTSTNLSSYIYRYQYSLNARDESKYFSKADNYTTFTAIQAYKRRVWGYSH